MAAEFGDSKPTNKPFGGNHPMSQPAHRPTDRTDAEILAALRETAAVEQRDLAAGGVTAAQIADYIDLSEPRIQHRLRDINDAVQVRGLNPDGMYPRWSWLPDEEVQEGFDD